jgi:hypothetical protein
MIGFKKLNDKHIIAGSGGPGKVATKDVIGRLHHPQRVRFGAATAVFGWPAWSLRLP